MRRMLIAGAAVAAVLAGATGGYRYGAGMWPMLQSHTPAPDMGVVAKTSPPVRPVLYWKHPDGLAEYAPAPARTSDGRDYLPVYDDEKKGFAGDATPGKTQSAAKEGRKLLYYRNPMGLADTSPVPKKDWMGMDYIPVYEGEEESGGTVKVSLDKVQRAGVRSEEVHKANLNRVIRAPGIVKPDERTLRTIALRADGFIEKLYANEHGKHVKVGEPLFRVYSQEMLRALVDYRLETGGAAGPGRAILTASQKLRNFEVPQQAIDEARRAKEVPMSFDWPSPVSGVVMEKKVVEGQMAKMGEELFLIGDLSIVWVIADVAEQDSDEVKLGASAKVRFRAIPGETFEGKVTFILHELDHAVRTAKARIEVENPDHRIRHEMYADVEIEVGADASPRIAVPASAVIDSGTRQIVLVDRGEGRFEPRPVKLGMRGEGLVEIREGLKAGERVVVSANFLIDAESNLKAALSTFTNGSSTAPAMEQSK